MCRVIVYRYVNALYELPAKHTYYMIDYFLLFPSLFPSGNLISMKPAQNKQLSRLQLELDGGKEIATVRRVMPKQKSLAA